MLTDEQYMRQAIGFARMGKGNVSPNPLVGTIIVKDGKIVGKGYHQKFGEAHAEINAIRDAGENTKGATLYVNLEPCCHHGKTPPCTEAIIKAGIKRVVVGMVDPNPLVNSQGINILRENGIDVKAGVVYEECKELNKVFIKYIRTGLPFVTLKVAQSIDGRIATMNGHSKWITSEESRIIVHKLRSEHDAVIIGAHTAKLDNPKLTVRHISGRNPFRIVLDSHLNIPPESKLITDQYAKLTIIATSSTDKSKKALLKRGGVKIWDIPAAQNGFLSLPDLLTKAASERISSLLIEGGSQVFTSFLRDKLVDEIIFMVAPKIIGDGIDAIGGLDTISVDRSIRLKNMRINQNNRDIIITAEVQYN